MNTFNLCLAIAIAFLAANFAVGDVSTLQARQTIKIGVASNFYSVAKELCNEFSRIRGIKRGNSAEVLVVDIYEEEKGRDALNSAEVSCVLIQSSSGKLVAQIINGASYDIFFSADQQRPELLYSKQLAEKPIIYAIGQLALVASEHPGSSGKTAKHKIELFKAERDSLKSLKIAIANPKVAPYGAAASEFLTRYLDREFTIYTLVQGHSAVQAYQFLQANAVDYAVVPLSYVYNTDTPYWVIPEKYHSPIFQALSVTNISKDNAIAHDFVGSICEPFWISIVEKHGYKKSPLCVNKTE